MRLPDDAHTTRRWRIHEIAGDFRVLDVWALPTPGGPDDFPRLVELWTSTDPMRDSPAAVRALFAIRERLGKVLGWDSVDAEGASTLRERLPDDLRDTVSGPPPPLGFTPLYQTADEWAAEVVNKTVHGVVHLGWVPDETTGHRGQLAILVKPNGWLGTCYLAAIGPFRHLIVYPQIIQQIRRAWLTTDHS